MVFNDVCLSVYPLVSHDISQTAAARITKLNREMFHYESWKPIYFGVKRSEVKVTRQKTVLTWVLRSCECWLSEWYVLCVVAKKNLCDLIQFVSGTPYLPAQVILTFNDDIVYPVAHACFNQLDLPTRHEQYDEFREAMSFALQHGTAFSTE